MGPIVYLIHMERRVNDARPAQHYVGVAASEAQLPVRLAQHASGRGAKILAAAVERGIGFELVRAWRGNRRTERKIKNRKGAPQLCPFCSKAHPQPVSGIREARGVRDRINPAARRAVLLDPAAFVAALATRHLQALVRHLSLQDARATHGNGSERGPNVAALLDALAGADAARLERYARAVALLTGPDALARVGLSADA